jgi:signal transduction histidine kinase
VTWSVCWVGWAFALAAAWTLHRRMARVADAEHELRGAATAIGLAADRDPLLQLQIDRMAAALADLAEARGASAPPPPDLEAGRRAQVLANVIANAAEHGVGPVEVRAVRLELRNRDRANSGGPGPGRGRGVVIAKRAARELGGSVRVERQDGVTRTVVELPRNERQDRAA